MSSKGIRGGYGLAVKILLGLRSPCAGMCGLESNTRFQLAADANPEKAADDVRYLGPATCVGDLD